MLNKLLLKLAVKFKTNLFKNSLWGILSNVFQNILYSVFFIVIVRKYSITDSANYIVANTLYSLVVAFSSLGLGQWFIRELMTTDDKVTLTNKFFKMQLYVGVFFYGVNILLSFLLYDIPLIRSLSLLIGINVLFDNIIYVIKHINIAASEQKKSFVILTVEALLKFLSACLLFFFPIPILFLSIILIALRFITLNLFIRIGTSNSIDLRQILKVKVNQSEIKGIILANWPFIVIGSVSILHWRIGNILASKILNMIDVTHFEISYKLFSMAVILPVIVSTSIYPLLIKAFNQSLEEVQTLYKKAFLAYTVYGLLAYTFIYSFSDDIIPFLFGAKYLITPVYCKQMFLTTLVCPTVLLQANLLVSMKLEKLDMWFNVICLSICLIICAVGFHFYKSLSVINYAIFFSFLAFHIIQDFVLLKRKISGAMHVISFYFLVGLSYLIYTWLTGVINKYLLFIGFWAILGLITAGIFFYWKKKDKPALA